MDGRRYIAMETSYSKNLEIKKGTLYDRQIFNMA